MLAEITKLDVVLLEGWISMIKRISEAIITAVSIAFITFLISFGFSKLYDEQATVHIGKLIEIEDNKYQIALNIFNYDEQAINKLRVSLPSNLSINHIKSSQSLLINKVETNIGDSTVSTFEIARVPENQNLQILFFLNKRIAEKDIFIEKNGNKIDVKNFDDIASPLEEKLTPYILSALLYGLLYSIINYYFDRVRMRRQEELDKRFEEQQKLRDELNTVREQTILESKKEIDFLREESGVLKQKIDRYQTESAKARLITSARLKEYRKELNFWRDTIRKVLYEKGEGDNAEKLISSVTENLETYLTKQSKDIDFESIKIYSQIFQHDDLKS